MRSIDETRGGKRNIERKFDAPGQFWKYVSQPIPKHALYSASEDGDQSFRHTKSYAEAMQLAEFGWPEGLDRIKPMVARFDSRIGRAMKSHQPEYDVVGECPDVGAFLAGEPEHMIRFEDKESDRRIVKIVFNATCSSAVSKDVIMRRGATACALVDALESSGIRAEIEVIFSVVGGSTIEHVTKVMMKLADEPLNMDRMAFGLAHPSFLRRLLFRAIELEDAKAQRAIGYGYGNCKDIPESGRGDIYFPSISGNYSWQTEDEAFAQAVAMLKKAGVEITEDDK